MADADTRVSEALKLYLVDGLPMRVIAKKLGMSRNTVRRIVGRGSAKKRTTPAQPRTSLLTPYEAKVKALLEETPELTGPAVLEKLRADGYRGGISRRSWPSRSSASATTTDARPASPPTALAEGVPRRAQRASHRRAPQRAVRALHHGWKGLPRPTRLTALCCPRTRPARPSPPAPLTRERVGPARPRR